MNNKDILNLFEKPEFEEDMLDEADSLVIFDTSVLLNLIPQTNETTQALIENISQKKAKVLIPYFVVWEFVENADRVLRTSPQSRMSEKDLRHKMDGYFKSIKKGIDVSSRPKVDDIFSGNEELNLVQGEINAEFEQKKKEFIDDFVKKVDKAQEIIKAGYSDSKKNLDELAEFIQEHIDQEFEITQDWITKIEAEGKARYLRKQAPGFNDSEKGETRVFKDLMYHTEYGDLLIWKELLEFLNKEKFKKVVFITDDGQSDKKMDLYHGNEKKVPKFSLSGEIFKINSDARLFLVPLKELAHALDVKNYDPQRLLKEGSQSDVLSQLANEVADNMKNSLDVESDLTDFLADALPEKTVPPEFPYVSPEEISSDISNVYIDDIDLTIKTADLEDYEIAGTIIGNLEIDYNADNRQYERDVDDGNSPSFNDSESFSFSVDFSGWYSVESSSFESMEYEGLKID